MYKINPEGFWGLMEPNNLRSPHSVRRMSPSIESRMYAHINGIFNVRTHMLQTTLSRQVGIPMKSKSKYIITT